MNGTQEKLKLESALDVIVPIGIKKKNKSEKQKAHIEKLNANQKGSNNRAWKGETVGYKGLHIWIRSRLEKPEKCPFCKTRNSREVANLDGKYSRDLTTWSWACRSCHLRMDQVADKAWATKRNKIKTLKCVGGGLSD